MGRINLSEWAIHHRPLMLFFMIFVALAGLRAYFALGQDEDPPFTIKAMVVQAYLPGADIEETRKQLTDRIERKLQETPRLDYLKSYTKPGESTIFVYLQDSTPKGEVPDIWYQVRKKVADIRHALPEETVGPFFNDEFGDTYGIIYGFTADGFTHRELRDYVENIRTEVLRIRSVGKVELLGLQEEKLYVECSPRILAKFGVSQQEVMEAVKRQNALMPGGTMQTERERILVESTGRILTAEELADVTIYAAGGKKIRLGDIAHVYRGYDDPPSPLFRVNGKDAIGLAVNMAKGGNILQLQGELEALMTRLVQELPAGIEARLVANQPEVVRDAVSEFTEALFEAVAIVLGISFLSLGMRAGTVVAFSIPFVLAFVFLGMQFFGIDLQRVSLGALIISLGLLVDDAMITVESMVSRLEHGWDKESAATYAYTNTAFPMLTGTLVTIIGFIPIGMSKSMAGEYCFSLFAVVAMALVVSWFVAVLFAPAIGMRVLSERMQAAHKGPGRGARAFHAMLLWCMRHSRTTVIGTIVLFALSVKAFTWLPQQFFPHSTRPEVLVDMTLAQNASIFDADRVSRRVDQILAEDRDVDHWSSYVGQGAIRFYLPLDQQLANDFFAQTVIVTKGDEERERVIARLNERLGREFPEAVCRVSTLELGPPVGWPVQFRLTGPDADKVQEYARTAADIVRRDADISQTCFDWGEKQRKLVLKIRQEEARRLGLSSSAAAQLAYAAVTGASVTKVRDDIYLVDVVFRADKDTRTSIEAVRNLDIQLKDGTSVPMSVIAEAAYVQDYPLVWSRDRRPTVTIKSQVLPGVLGEVAAARIGKKLADYARTLPQGYRIDPAGSTEESAKSSASVMATIPYMIMLMLVVLMIQLQDFRHLFLVVAVAPAGLIGVVLGLGISGNPMGFVALLGIVALIGMIIRNSVILVHQIGVEKKPGVSEWDALVEAATVRCRPIMLTAVAAMLGMLPIAPTVFWGPMANAIMGGLAVATVLTLLFLPALYVWWFGLKEEHGEGSGDGSGGEPPAEPAPRPGDASAKDRNGLLPEI